MNSRQSLASDLVFERAKAAVDEIVKLRPLTHTRRAQSMPVFFSPDLYHKVDPMEFKIGQPTDTPWEGVTCFGISLSENEVVILCEVLRPIRFEAHQHGPWEEKLVMETGVLYEHTTGESYAPGSGVYHQKAGQIHEPDFLAPSRCVITWTKSPEDRA